MSRKKPHRFSASALALLLCLAPAWATADEPRVSFGFETVGEYDDNVFSRETGEQSSRVTRTTPSLHITQGDRRTNYTIEGSLTDRSYWDVDEADGLDRRYGFSAEHGITPRWTIGMRAFEKVQDKRDEFEDGELVQGERPDQTRRNIEFASQYALGPRTTLRARMDLAFIDNGSNDISLHSNLRDSDDIGGSLALEYMATRADRATLQLRGVRTEADPTSDSGLRGEHESSALTAEFVWTRKWNPNWESQAAVGLTWLTAESEERGTDPLCFPNCAVVRS